MLQPQPETTVPKRFRKKPLLIILCGSALLLLALYFLYQSDTQQFKRLSKELLKDSFSQDTLSLHYFLDQPSAYGIKVTEQSLPCYDANAEDLRLTKMRDRISLLESLDSAALCEQDRQCIDLLLNYMKEEADLASYSYFYEPLSPSNGMQTQLPILLAEYRLNSVEDIDNYLLLLQEIPDYYDSLYVYETQKAGAGMFMSNRSCKQVIYQLQKMADVNAISQNTHFLCTTFEERVRGLENKELLSAEEADTYIQNNQTILTNCFSPANLRLAENLLTLFDSGSNDEGLCNYPNGKEYYALLLKHTTGSSKSIPEIRELLKNEFTANYQTLCELSKVNTGDRNTELESLSTPEDMLSALQTCMREDFPSYPGDDINVTYSVKKVSKGLEPFVSPAYYMTPQYDNLSNNSIYINYGQSPSTLTLFTTLAHEGYPGHLYQSVYYYRSMEQNHTPPIRALLHYGGYIEGYATYAENYSYRYAQNYCTSNYVLVSQSMRNLQLCLYSMMDIAIHYDAMTLEEATQTLASIGITDTRVAEEIYYYIASEPTNYLKYYLGYLEFLECQQLAKDSWGDSYSDSAFHQFILDFGPADFENIKKAIPSWNGF